MTIKKIGTKIILVACICILFTAIAAIIALNIGNNVIVNDILHSDSESALTAIVNETDDMKKSSAQLAAEIARSSTALKAVEDKSQFAIVNAVKMIMKSREINADFVVITDSQGIVLSRTDSMTVGDSAASLKSISKAIQGDTGSYYEEGSQVKLAITSSAPIKNDKEQIVGAVSVGYKLDNTVFLDKLKEITANDFTIFLKDTRINTTITVDNKRQVNSQMDPMVAKAVLEKKQNYEGEIKAFGNTYYTMYQPILDENDEVVGAFLGGNPITDIKARQAKTNFIAIFIVLLVTFVMVAVFANFSRKNIAAPVSKMSALAKRLANGDLDADGFVYNSNDEIGELAVSLKTTVETLYRYVNDISTQLNYMANADMTSEIEQEYVGDFKPIKDAMLTISDSLNTMLSDINQAVEQVASGAEQVSSGSQALAQGTTEQASSIEELSASINDVSEQIRQNTDNVTDMKKYIQETVNDVEGAHSKMQELLEAMEQTRIASDKIGKIIKVIDDIAFQTNILALNAAVEAARAGSAGKGFAVVADEVRNLAGKSANAAQQTSELIQTSIERVKNGFKIADEAGQAVSSVSGKMYKMTGSINDIEKASVEQASAINQITQGIEQISGVVQNNSATAEESAAASEELSGQAAIMYEQVSRFKLKNNKGKNTSNRFEADIMPEKPEKTEFEEVLTGPVQAVESEEGFTEEQVVEESFNEENFNNEDRFFEPEDTKEVDYIEDENVKDEYIKDEYIKDTESVFNQSNNFFDKY